MHNPIVLMIAEPRAQAMRTIFSLAAAFLTDEEIGTLVVAICEVGPAVALQAFAAAAPPEGGRPLLRLRLAAGSQPAPAYFPLWAAAGAIAMKSPPKPEDLQRALKELGLLNPSATAVIDAAKASGGTPEALSSALWGLFASAAETGAEYAPEGLGAIGAAIGAWAAGPKGAAKGLAWGMAGGTALQAIYKRIAEQKSGPGPAAPQLPAAPGR